MQVNNVSISTKSGRDIVSNLSFILNEGDKLAIIGEEGNGKSTLLKYFYDQSLIEDYCYCSGTITFSSVGYLPQMMDEGWYTNTVLEYFLKDNYNSEIRYEVYNDLYVIEKLFDEYGLDKKMLEDDRTIKVLSGGERIKIQLIKLVYSNPKVILLDEPTNDLDIYTLEILEDYLESFVGPLLCVSHDRYFLDKVCDKLLCYENGYINTYMGSFSEYLEQDNQTKKKQEPKTQYKSSRNMTAKEKNELFDLEKELPKLDEEIEKLKEKLSTLTTEYVQMMEIQKEIDELTRISEEKTMRYFELMEKKEM